MDRRGAYRTYLLSWMDPGREFDTDVKNLELLVAHTIGQDDKKKDNPPKTLIEMSQEIRRLLDI